MVYGYNPCTTPTLPISPTRYLAIRQEMVWTHWFTYATLAYFGVTVAFWLYRLNAALGKYDALYIIPMLQASYIVLATIAGGIFFQVFRQSADLSCISPGVIAYPRSPLYLPCT